jgi:hypothetical protein
MATVKSVRAMYDQQNEACARLILQDLERYGGEGAGAVVWARLCLARIERERLESVGPLFRVA